MRAQPLPPYAATILVSGVPTWRAAAMRAQPLGPSGELCMGATRRVRYVPNSWATAMRVMQLGFSVECFVWGHEAREGCAEMSGGRLAGAAVGAVGRAFPWGRATRQGVLKWQATNIAGAATGAFGGTPYWGRKMCKGCAKNENLPHCHCGIRRNSLSSHATCKGCADMTSGRLAGAAFGGLGGIPFGGHEQCEGVPK